MNDNKRELYNKWAVIFADYNSDMVQHFANVQYLWLHYTIIFVICRKIDELKTECLLLSFNLSQIIIYVKSDFT